MPYEAYGTGVTGVVLNAGAPVAGTNEVQTLTFGGTWLATETFKLVYDGFSSAAITWNATNATLLSRVQAALDAFPNGATNAIVATAGTLTAGIGTMLLTFSGAPLSARAVNNIVVSNNTSASGTLVNAETTPGVTATRRDAVPGSLLLDTSGKKLYIHTGTQGAPTWTVVGAQS